MLDDRSNVIAKVGFTPTRARIVTQRGRVVSELGSEAGRLKLQSDEQLVAIAATEQDLYLATSSRFFWRGRHDVEVPAPVSLTRRPSMLVGHDDFALCLYQHADHDDLRVIDFYTEASTELSDLRSTSIAQVPRACTIAADLPFLIDVEARPSLRGGTLVEHGDDVCAAHLAPDAIAICRTLGTLELLDPEPRSLGMVPLDLAEVVVELVRSPTGWIAITNRCVPHVFPSGGGAPIAYHPPDAFPTPQYVFDAPPVVDASPDGRWLLAGGYDPNRAWPLHMWRLGPGPPPDRPLPLLAPGIGGVGPLHAFSPDGRWLATGTHLSSVLLWDLHSVPEPAPAREVTNPRCGSAGTSSRVLAMRFRPDQRLVIAWDNGTDLVDVEAGIVATTPSGAPTSRAAILSASGAWLVRDRADGRWLSPSTDLSRSVRIAPPELSDAAFSIDDRARWLVTGDNRPSRLSPIDPYGPSLDPIDLGRPQWLWLAPAGDLLITLDGEGNINHYRLDATRALHELIPSPRTASPA